MCSTVDATNFILDSDQSLGLIGGPKSRFAFAHPNQAVAHHISSPPPRPSVQPPQRHLLSLQCYGGLRQEVSTCEDVNVM
jgi:hypothetical protein